MKKNRLVASSAAKSLFLYILKHDESMLKYHTMLVEYDAPWECHCKLFLYSHDIQGVSANLGQALKIQTQVLRVSYWRSIVLSCMEHVIIFFPIRQAG